MKRFTRRKAVALHTLLKTVKQRIENINSGGCGVFAYYLSEFLSTKGYSSRIICLDMEFDRHDAKHHSNMQAIANRDKKSSFAYDHFGLRVGNYYIDSENLVRSEELPVIYRHYKPLGTISRSDLNFLNSLDDKWNHRYDRSQNELMKRLLYAVVGKFSQTKN
ncbi:MULTISPECIES: hypothetical protein [Sphingobacterium]|uniref:hypothetical protein n=1 Tax=Sphingobacterium TaxID=28453 RepID=UPI00257A9C33|nr:MULTISPECIES: hypothetical protein [Sphingobacterium]